MAYLIKILVRTIVLVLTVQGRASFINNSPFSRSVLKCISEEHQWARIIRKKTFFANIPDRERSI